MDKLFPELNDIDNRRIEDIGVAMKEIIRLRELLRRAYKDALKSGHCHFCLMEFYVDYSEWRHAVDCKLAEELGDD